MQNSIVTRQPLAVPAPQFPSWPVQQGSQWRPQKLDSSRGGGLLWRRGGRGLSGAFVVAAFFGGSKSTPVKDAGKGCFNCLGKGAVDCAGCKGTGRNKKNGNMFERWKCYDCQGFGLVGCPKCGTGGLTPEQRGER